MTTLLLFYPAVLFTNNKICSKQIKLQFSAHAKYNLERILQIKVKSEITITITLPHNAGDEWNTSFCPQSINVKVPWENCQNKIRKCTTGKTFIYIFTRTTEKLFTFVK